MRCGPRQPAEGSVYCELRAGEQPVHEVRAEITANVILVQVKVGQPVAEGDELAILESMKMEIPVLAPVAGVVERVAISAGTTVAEGDVIAVIGGVG